MNLLTVESITFRISKSCAERPYNPQLKPQDHCETCIITQESSYEVAGVKGTQASSGTLYRGRVVWTQKTPGTYADSEKILAYAVGVEALHSIEQASLWPGNTLRLFAHFLLCHLTDFNA